MKVRFVLICEGTSDEALIPHLRSLLVSHGAEEASGITIDFARLPAVSRSVEARIRVAFTLEQNIDLLFVHRDADSTNAEPRYSDIAKGVGDAGYQGRWIGVVPVQETEAWLLLDENAIRRVSGRPRGREQLNLPIPRQVEQVASPKGRLFEAILIASESTGRRQKRVKRKLPALRSQLLKELRIGGQLTQVQSWVRLEADINRYIEEAG